ncbi:hypothetical protein DER45DRAFT_636425 [Fusarium avenaceum]|nr:hypothetical protein DER45DRAFT_636425 [Fusarium avenaceum]
MCSTQAFKDASERQITDHSIHLASRLVTFTIKYRSPASDLITALLPEITVQEIDEPLVLKYWTEVGGRAITGFGKDHVFKVLEETKRYWAVQWVGYSAEEDLTIEEKDVVARKCPEAIVKWRKSLSREHLVMVQHFSVGVDVLRGIPAWYSDLPEVEIDELDDEEKERLGIF